MVEAESTTPEITFEEAIALTQTMLDQLEQGQLSDAQLEGAIASLVGTENGARGFFVTYLSDPRPVADQPTASVIQGLQAATEIVAELLVKNLAMSSAMAVAHRRNGNEEMAQGSDRVRSRTVCLIQQLHSTAIADRARQLHESTTTGEGAYHAFLKRWGYDAEQRQVIQQAMEGILAYDHASDGEGSGSEAE
ncbi:hypothetical protein H6G89_17270 [Oscillatoria sp. FACHB-1407]|uniref:hypothetical protein n=1 Tax=Oscillatoria sp. FACHB-1407 TaxID=2692847 RepID=UPI001682BE25|nr:hypothetical protein [Oscillatoria sp. FACHB-1407]MBD2462792.1 hypothetical protein [Oscillatoria sp. FACHB-1407]